MKPFCIATLLVFVSLTVAIAAGPSTKPDSASPIAIHVKSFNKNADRVAFSGIRPPQLPCRDGQR